MSGSASFQRAKKPLAFRRLVGEAVQARNFLRITPRSPSAPLPKSTRLEGSGTGEDCEIVSLQPGPANFKIELFVVRVGEWAVKCTGVSFQ